MDTSTALSLLSILISVIFAAIAFYFSNKTDQTLASIQEKINVQHDSFMRMLEQEQETHHDYVVTVTKLLAAERGWSNEKADAFEEELKVLRRPSLDITSLLSKQSKLGK